MRFCAGAVAAMLGYTMAKLVVLAFGALNVPIFGLDNLIYALVGVLMLAHNPKSKKDFIKCAICFWFLPFFLVGLI